MKIPISDLIRDQTLNVRDRVDDEVVLRYMQVLDQLPPIDVFDTDEGLLVADGFTRTEAYERSGRTHIDAKKRQGTRRDAEVFAAEANTSHGKPLTQKERRRAAERLLTLTDLDHHTIAERLAVNESTVRRIAGAMAVADQVPEALALNPSHRDAISVAPKSTWKLLVGAVANREWTVDEVEAAVKAIKDRRTPQTHKDALLAGRTDPVYQNDNGKATISTDSLGRQLKQARDRDVYAALLRIISNGQVLRQRYELVGDESFHDVRRDDLVSALADIERLQKLLGDLHPLIAKELTALRVVA